MNRIKISFAAACAILAMSFTIASREGAFNKKAWNPKYSYTCVNGTDVIAFCYCSGLITNCVDGSTPASSVPGAGACTFNVTRAGVGHFCDETQNFFCCFQPAGTCTPGPCTRITTGVKIGTLHFNSTQN